MQVIRYQPKERRCLSPYKRPVTDPLRDGPFQRNVHATPA
jgi:hypothetical protein